MSSGGARPAAGGQAPARAVAIFGSFRYGPYYEDLLDGVVSAARPAGTSVIAVQTSAGVMPSGFEVQGQQAVGRAGWDHFDSAIVVLQAVSLDYVARLRAAGKFVVAIGQDRRRADAVITIDNAGGVHDAVTHLAGHGHTRIGFLAPTWQADAAERYRAYRGRMAQLGLEALPQLGGDLPAELSMDEQGHLGARRFLAEGHDCTAVLVGTDLIALGFVRGVRAAGLSVPGDLAVVGIDDVDQAAVSSPPLATVAISFERVGETAFTVASSGGRGEPTRTRYVVPERFVPRESCGCTGGILPSGEAAGRATGRADGSGVRTGTDAFAAALVAAARESTLVGSTDVDGVIGVARRVGAHLRAAADGEPVDTAPVAAELSAVCRLDRSVQAAIEAVRALAESLAAGVREPEHAWHLSRATLDLCDAVRSGQLQRRMAEYVDLRRMQLGHYSIGNTLLGNDRSDLRSLRWLRGTQAQAGALGLWNPAPGRDRVRMAGVYDRGGVHPSRAEPAPDPRVEAFPPPWLLRGPQGQSRLTVVTQVRFEESDWGVLAVAGGDGLKSALVQETFQQWATWMCASLDQEKANAELAQQADELAQQAGELKTQAKELTAAYQTEMALLEEVRLSEERYALAAEASHDALWDWDVAAGTVFYSSSWKALLGYREQDVGSSPDEWLGRVHEEDAPSVRAEIDQVLTGAREFADVEHRVRVAGGEYRWIACSARAVLGAAGTPIRLVGSITDVTARRLMQEQLVQEALYDQLTGLAKRTLFRDRLNQAIERAKRRPDYLFAVLFVDLDGFKEVNDTLGHAAGDALLASVARRLRDSLRSNDTAARFGGDEFAILLDDVDHVAELPLTVRRIQSLLGEPHRLGRHTVVVSAAIGVSASAGGPADADAMLHEADTNMYRSKRRAKAAAGRLAPERTSG